MEPILSQTIYPEFDWYWAVLVVALVFAGIWLLGFEIFVTPGFGVPGIVGLIFLLGGVVVSWTFLGPTWGSLISVASCVVSTATFILALKSKFFKNRFILDKQQEHGKGTQAEDLKILVGRTGTARTDLRPAGIVSVGQDRIDVVSDGGYIEKGREVEIVSVDGPRVVVAEKAE